MVGRIIYQDGIFLGREELERQQSLQRSLLISSIRRGQSQGLYQLNSLATITIQEGNVDISSSSPEDIVIGTDFQMNPIVLPGTSSAERCQTPVSEAGTFDVYLYYKNHNYEKGTVTIDTSGYVTGLNTQFTEIFRNSMKGRYSRMMTSDGNIRIIQNVIDDTNLQLYGEVGSFIAGQNLKFQVYPTLSTFYTGSDEQPIYSYDFAGILLSPRGEAPDQAESVYFKIGWITIQGNDTEGWSLSSQSWEQITIID